jgi:hypothetical protein
VLGLQFGLQLSVLQDGALQLANVQPGRAASWVRPRPLMQPLKYELQLLRLQQRDADRIQEIEQQGVRVPRVAVLGERELVVTPQLNQLHAHRYWLTENIEPLRSRLRVWVDQTMELVVVEILLVLVVPRQMAQSDNMSIAQLGGSVCSSFKLSFEPKPKRGR